MVDDLTFSNKLNMVDNLTFANKVLSNEGRDIVDVAAVPCVGLQRTSNSARLLKSRGREQGRCGRKIEIGTLRSANTYEKLCLILLSAVRTSQLCCSSPYRGGSERDYCCCVKRTATRFKRCRRLQ